MKKFILSGVVMVLAVAGCATAPPDPNERVVVDQQKIDLVEAWARAKGVTVLWMNTPMRTVRVPPQGN
jgi:hypothetical protein